MLPMPEQSNAMNTSHNVSLTEHNRLIVTPLSLNTVEDVLAQESLEYVRDGEMVRTGFINNSISLAICDDYLLARSQWRANVPTDQAAQLLAHVNEWNLTTLLPTVKFYETTDHNLRVTSHRALLVSEGASFNQVGAFVVSTIDAFVDLWNHFDVAFPHLVSWENADA